MDDKLILDGIDYSGMTIQDMFEEFYWHTDSLCENTPPDECDCSKCPTKELCKYLMPTRPNC